MCAVIIWTTDHKEAHSLPWPPITPLNNVSSKCVTKISNKEIELVAKHMNIIYNYSFIGHHAQYGIILALGYGGTSLLSTSEVRITLQAGYK